MTPERILIDTSAWIASFKRAGGLELKEYMRNAVRAGVAATTPVIILELLQGCRSEEERDELRLSLESLEVLAVTQPVWERAYDLGFSLPRRGLTIPTADLIVAAVAIESECILLHRDRHYELLARHSRLSARSFG
jgi:predicted nucleic acid-binding protein